MKLRRIAIERLPGIDRPFEIEGLGDGLSIICGPNGIGKSRLCAAVRALLWPESDVVRGALVARADFEHEARRWQVRRDHSLYRWQRDGIDLDPPPLPAAHLDACFFLGLRDLLDDQDHAGRNLAAEIRRQMSGGFDLVAVARRFQDSVGARIGQTERKAVDSAENEIRRAGREQAEVEARERELEDLLARAAEAERAAPRRAYFEMALSLQRQKRELALCERSLAELPADLARLDGREVERLGNLDESLEDRRRERQAAGVALGEAREVARTTRLEEPLESALLSTWRDRAEQVGDLERELKDARIAEQAAREVLAERRRALGGNASLAVGDDPSLAVGDDPSMQALTLDDDFDLFAFLQESQHLTRELDVVRERLRVLSDSPFSDEERRGLETARRAVESLRAWLRAPDPLLRPDVAGHDASARRILAAGVIASLTVSIAWLVGSAVLAELPVWLPGLAGVVIGIGSAGIAALFARRGRPGRGDPSATNWRDVARTRFPDAVEPPESWSTESVTRRLQELEDRLAQADAKEKRALMRLTDRRPLEESLKELEGRSAALEERRRALVSRLGLERLGGDAEIVDLLRGLETLRQASAEVRRAAARTQALEVRTRSALAELGDFVSGLGEARPGDGAAARATVHALETRSRTLAEAIAEASRCSLGRDRLDAEVERLEAERSELFARAGVEMGDRAALGRRVAELPRFHELNAERSRLTSVIEHAESELESAGEADLAGLDIVELEEGLATLNEQARERSKLDQRIAVIRSDALRARTGHVVEEAIAKKQAALSALRDRRDEALLALAGESLIESVRREYEKEQMPRVLERTRRRFGTFTHHAYEVEISPDDDGSFVAIDGRTGEGLRPDQLSDGTRAQLILAARLAFAEEAERGAELPLFLDEAMDHSDPERFHAIARSLARMVAEEGRQIFYLTNDPTDVARFEQAFAEERVAAPVVLDLERIRGHAERVERPEALRVAPLPVVAPPADDDATRYGLELGVPKLDPRLDPGAQHVYYLLRDDLPLLHAFLEARIVSVGQCRNQLDGGSEFAKSICEGDEVAMRLRARIDLLETFCQAWREGRGRSVDRAALEASEVVSVRFIDAFDEVVSELGGDARRFVAALAERDDPRLKGYRRESADKLEQFLSDQGYLDERTPLSETQIVERAIATPAASRLEAKNAAELVHQWWSLSHHSKSD